MTKDWNYTVNWEFEIKYSPPPLSVKQIARKILHKKGLLVLGRDRKVMKQMERILYDMKDRRDIFINKMTPKKFEKFKNKHPMIIVGSRGTA